MRGRSRNTESDHGENQQRAGLQVLFKTKTTAKPWLNMKTNLNMNNTRLYLITTSFFISEKRPTCKR